MSAEPKNACPDCIVGTWLTSPCPKHALFGNTYFTEHDEMASAFYDRAPSISRVEPDIYDVSDMD